MSGRGARRGYVLALTACVLAVVSALVVVLAQSIETQVQARARQQLRVQALWLARSAVLTGCPRAVTVMHAGTQWRVGCVAAGVQRTGTAASGRVHAEVKAMAGTRGSWTDWTERFHDGDDG